jgi:hypothetical protein
VKLVVKPPTTPTDYTSIQSAISVNFDIVVGTPTCNCNEQPWDNGSLATTTANVAISSTYTITAPSPNAGAYSATPAMRACAANACATTGTFTTVTMADDSALPAWITHSAGVLTILAPDGSVKASNPWTIKIVYTPTEGSNTPTYDAVAITIDCEITSFTTSNTPANQAYTIWDALKVVNLSGVTYTQVPACGYAFTSTYVFTTTGSVSYINAGTAIVPSV